MVYGLEVTTSVRREMTALRRRQLLLPTCSLFRPLKDGTNLNGDKKRYLLTLNQQNILTKTISLGLTLRWLIRWDLWWTKKFESGRNSPQPQHERPRTHGGKKLVLRVRTGSGFVLLGVECRCKLTRRLKYKFLRIAVAWTRLQFKTVGATLYYKILTTQSRLIFWQRV